MGWVEGVKMGTEWYNDRIAKERQDRIEAQNKQLFDAKMEEIDRAKREREALAQASASVTPNVSNPTLDTSANAVPDPEIAKNVPTQYSVNGMQQADMPSMQNTVRDMTARNQAAALNRLGNPMAALNLTNAADESKLNGFKVANAETAQADDKFNRHVDEIIARSPDKWTGLAAIGTETQVGPMKDVKVRVQSDGTNMRFVSTLPDGTERPGSTYPNTDEGFMKARADLMRLDPATKSKILAEQVKSARDSEKDKADIDLKKAQTAYYGSMADVAGRKVDATSDKLSEIDKMELQAISKQKDRINEAIIKAKAEGSFDATTPGASSLTTQLAALGLKERQITQKYGAPTASPDPLGMRKPSTSEAQMRVQATGDMGADPKALQREIEKTSADIAKVTDQSSKNALLTHLEDLKRQQMNISAPVQSQQSAAPMVRMQDTAKPAFNEAGYKDTQSTIEGAKRGDKKAVELLKKLIPMGETTPAQRAQIQELFAGK